MTVPNELTSDISSTVNPMIDARLKGTRSGVFAEADSASKALDAIELIEGPVDTEQPEGGHDAAGKH